MHPYLRPYYLLIFCFFNGLTAQAQQLVNLETRLAEIVRGKQATVGVAILGLGGQDTLLLNGYERLPMQSVFKFHIGIVMMAAIDEGRFTLDQPIKIRKRDLLPGLYSPIRDAHLKGATLPVREILQYTIALSDNVGCDILLRLLGGPAEVERYFHQRGFEALAIKINEETMQANWELQFQNWTTPLEATRVLAAFYNPQQPYLSPQSYDTLWQIMTSTKTGQQRLKGQLPTGTAVAHKTGWSGTNAQGITAATNDIGVISLPNGQPLFISVFVADSKEDNATNEAIIAQIAEAAWDYYANIE
ncbi:class A beta-lactamase, subclass A2 [Eisenibacter elegans]|uniref:class A beta-lactamase, subclass A2 n=1 Tax=Eisenibacter elegans TaxID=997 RepID=UPI00041B25B4|nr:class A beta-lactamase, subclass A2 [Eisenibacter elegans]